MCEMSFPELSGITDVPIELGNITLLFSKSEM